jgi:hypothetical protein
MERSSLGNYLWTESLLENLWNAADSAKGFVEDFEEAEEELDFSGSESSLLLDVRDGLQYQLAYFISLLEGSLLGVEELRRRSGCTDPAAEEDSHRRCEFRIPKSEIPIAPADGQAGADQAHADQLTVRVSPYSISAN